MPLSDTVCACTPSINRYFQVLRERCLRLSVVGGLVLCVFATPGALYAACASGVPVNINTADSVALETLPGIGPAKSTAIIEYRETNGAFTKTVDIQEVSGIGPSTYEAIKLCITVGDVSPPPEDQTATETETEVTSTSGGGGAKKSEPKVELPPPELSVLITAPQIAYVNQPLLLRAEPSGISDALLASVSHRWNFGDMHAATGTEVHHAYAYAGEYVITVYASFARHETVARHEITVLPAQFSITRAEDGAIQIHNDARYEIDISGFTLLGTNSFTFPEHSIMLPRATITVPEREVAGSGGVVQLLDQERKLVAQYPSTETMAIHTPGAGMVAGEQVSYTNVTETQPESFGFAREVETDTNITEIPVAPQIAGAHETTASFPKEALPYLGLIGVISIAIGALYATGSRHVD